MTTDTQMVSEESRVVRSLIEYTGEGSGFVWKVKTGKASPGMMVGGLYEGEKAGYAPYYKAQVNKREYLAKELLWLYHSGFYPERALYYLNDDPTDNRIENITQVPSGDPLTAEGASVLWAMDSDSSFLVWRISYCKGVKVGQRTGSACDNGYLKTMYEKKAYLVHRVAWALHHGEWPDGDIDHINGVKTDNSLNNLRVVSSEQNSRNAKLYSNNLSGVSGVIWAPKHNKWLVYIGTKYLGRYSSKEDAIAVRMTAEASEGYDEYHGKTNEVRASRPVVVR